MSNFHDNSTANQREKVLAYLEKHKAATVEELKTNLDVLAPPARIKELRDRGYSITTIWKEWESDYGIKHRVGQYVLHNSQQLLHDCE